MSRKQKIGVIGCGVVGSAVSHGFQRLGHSVVCHDKKFDNTSVQDVCDSRVVFICAPTPSKEDGSCNIDIVKEIIQELFDANYEGIICIKSTVPPGTTQHFKEYFSTENICFVPEFLRERCAISDFVDNHDVCIIGADGPDAQEQYEIIKECHGSLPDQFSHLSPKEAEFCKYFNNCYNALLITFANSFYTICKEVGVDYAAVKGACIKRKHINDIYLDCNENMRGFGGVCLPKDTKAMDHLCKANNTDVHLFENILEENEKYKRTVFPGMRES